MSGVTVIPLTTTAPSPLLVIAALSDTLILPSASSVMGRLVGSATLNTGAAAFAGRAITNASSVAISKKRRLRFLIRTISLTPPSA